METLYKLSSLVLPSGPLSSITTTTDATISTPSTTSSSLLMSILSPIIDLLHKNHHNSTSSSPPLYELQTLISALSIFFCRFVIINGSLTSSPDGHTSVFGHSKLEFVLRLCMSCILGGMVYMNLSYDVICSVELWSHVFPTLIRWFVSMFKGKKENNDTKLVEPSFTLSIGIATIILLSPPISLYTCRLLSNPAFLTSFTEIIPSQLSKTLQYMFPIHQLHASYNIIHSFVSNKDMLHDMLCHLLFVTAHIQVGLGHIGIAFLTSEQRRKNMLIRMDVDNPSPPLSEEGNENDDASSDDGGKRKKGKGNGTLLLENIKKKKFDPSAKFRRSAPTFILFTVLPYMFQIILFGKFGAADVWGHFCSYASISSPFSSSSFFKQPFSYNSFVFSYQ